MCVCVCKLSSQKLQLGYNVCDNILYIWKLGSDVPYIWKHALTVNCKS